MLPRLRPWQPSIPVNHRLAILEIAGRLESRVLPVTRSIGELAVDEHHRPRTLFRFRRPGSRGREPFRCRSVGSRGPIAQLVRASA